MPKHFQKEFKLQKSVYAHIRKKPNGSFEIRYRRNGYNLSVTAKSIELAKERFLKKLSSTSPEQIARSVTFKDFSLKWIDIVKKPATKETTYKGYIRLLEYYIFPKLGNLQIKDIRPMYVQELLNGLIENKTARTAEACYVLLKPIFEFAVAEDLISKTPMLLIKKPRHETIHGSALTKEEEKEFIANCLQANTPCTRAFIFILLTGIRRSELATAEISEKWVTVINAKTKKGMTPKKRRIPISPMLRRFTYLIDDEVFKVDAAYLTHKFPELSPGHHLHDLRHTFITRCQECGISRELTSLWAGHKADNTMTSNVYTHFSDEFQLQEIEKLRY